MMNAKKMCMMTLMLFAVASCHAATSRADLETKRKDLTANVNQLRSTVALTRAEMADHNNKIRELNKEKGKLQGVGMTEISEEKKTRLSQIGQQIQSMNTMITQKKGFN